VERPREHGNEPPGSINYLDILEDLSDLWLFKKDSVPWSWLIVLSVVLLYKEDGLKLIIYACHSWEMALNVGLNVCFGNMRDWKGIREKVGDVNSTNAYITTNSQRVLHSFLLIGTCKLRCPLKFRSAIVLNTWKYVCLSVQIV
jgi:hypothetical protein